MNECLVIASGKFFDNVWGKLCASAGLTLVRDKPEQNTPLRKMIMTLSLVRMLETWMLAQSGRVREPQPTEESFLPIGPTCHQIYGGQTVAPMSEASLDELRLTCTKLSKLIGLISASGACLYKMPKRKEINPPLSLCLSFETINSPSIMKFSIG